MDPLAILRDIPLFAETLDPADLAEVAAAARQHTFLDGAILMAQGDLGSSMFVIVSGEVVVTYEGERGGEHVVACLTAGDVVGEMCLLTGAPRAGTVVARGRVTTLEIRKADLEPVFARSPELLDRFAAILADRQAGLGRIAADADLRRSLGLRKEEIAGQISRFFATILGGERDPAQG